MPFEEKVDFISFIMRMATGAYIALGLVEHPETKEKKKDLELAKFTIDTLDMLKMKTKGNLTKEEEVFFNEILSDLKLKFVKVKEEE
jgi:hypothetical protein